MHRLPSISAASLKEHVSQWQDVAATFGQSEEIRRLAFTTRRVYVSKARLRAEAYLHQN